MVTRLTWREVPNGACYKMGRGETLEDRAITNLAFGYEIKKTFGLGNGRGARGLAGASGVGLPLKSIGWDNVRAPLRQGRCYPNRSSPSSFPCGGHPLPFPSLAHFPSKLLLPLPASAETLVPVFAASLCAPCHPLSTSSCSPPSVQV